MNAFDFKNIFSPSAYLLGDDESDSSNEEKEKTPEILKEIRKVYYYMRKYIKPYFSKFKLDIEIIRGVKKGNNKIKRLNLEAKRPSDIYLVLPNILYALI